MRPPRTRGRVLPRGLVAAGCFSMAALFAGSGERNGAPIEIACRVADKVIRETSFAFELRPQRPGQGIQRVDLGWNLSGPGVDSGFARATIRSRADTTLRLGLSHSVPLEIRVNGSTVYRSPGGIGRFREFAYDMYRFPSECSVRLRSGENTIVIGSTIVDSATRADLAFLDVDGRLSSTAEFVTSSGTGGIWSYASGSSASNGTWQGPRVRMVKKDVIPDAASFRGHSYFEWHYANGQMTHAIIALGDATGEKRYLEWAGRYCQTTLSTLEEFRRQYEDLQERTGFNYRIFRRTMLDDAGAPSLPFIDLTERGVITGARPLIDTMAAWVMRGQERLADGTVCRPEPTDGTVWADDLFMSVLFLLGYGELTGEAHAFDDAVSQITGIYERLYDAEKGLSAHAWFDPAQRRSVAFWGRANGWMAWGISEALLRLPRTHPGYPPILRIFREQMAGLLRVQGGDGMWHQLLDHPETYEETSCTAMFVLALARGVRQGWLDPECRDAARRGWNGVKRRIAPDGTVAGICQGTGVGPDLEFYATRKTPPHDPRGLGAVIMAGIEMQQLGDR